jgi:alpha-tubulin suppressor-like RCC1 family protein
MTRAIRWVLVVLPVWVLAMSCRDSAGDRRVELRQAAVVATSSPIGKARSLGTGFGLHACALLDGGKIGCWGKGGDGELGNGGNSHAAVPVLVNGIADATQIAVGLLATCALRSGGQISCWGRGGSLAPTQSSNVPVSVAAIAGAVAVARGDLHACALDATGKVRCWGSGVSGQLGDGLMTDSSTPVVVSGLSGVVSISAGPYTTCAVRGDGTVTCWGLFFAGPTPVDINGIGDAIAVAVGYRHGCALRRSGGIACFGSDRYGQLGNGVFADSTTTSAVAVQGLADAIALGAGGWHSCAVRSTGQTTCWGNGGHGQLGDGGGTNSAAPVTVSGVHDAVAVAGGYTHTCVARATGEVVCFGDGSESEGALGAGDPASSLVPVTVSGVSDATSVAPGYLHTCVRHANGDVGCWGSNVYDQIGQSSGDGSALPVAVPNLHGALAVAAGYMDSCALLGDASVACWGSARTGGQLTTSGSPIPSAVPGLGDATQIASNYLHSCARRASGQITCWGRDVTSGSSAPVPVPVTVADLNDATSVGVGIIHSCALRTTGEVVCWGFNSDGQLGSGAGTPSPSSAPVSVADVHNAVGIAVGGFHGCALRATGEVVCWGGISGQKSTNAFTPIAIAGLTNATSIAAGENHTCALRAGGGVVCWGNGADGRLGAGSLADADTPVSVLGLTDAVSIAAGYEHSCAIRAGGEIVCWGMGLSGQLGAGGSGTLLSRTPVAVLGLTDNRGQHCASGADCFSGFCVDGVCCANACGGGDPKDCQACSVAAGAASDGVCGPRASGAACGAAPGICETAGACGGAATCPGPTPIPSCSAEPLPACVEPDCSEVSVDLDGGTAAVGGMTLTFGGDVTSSGSVAVVASGVGPPPPTGFQIVGFAGQPRYWNIDTTARINPPIEVCIHYDQSWIQGTESLLRLVHDDGSGFQNITTSVDTVNNIVCGVASSLSPFAIVEPLDSAPPVFSNVPGTIVAFATSTAGVKVTYALQDATDSVDGARPVTCAPGSGATFAVGKTIVSCSAADKTGNESRATFTVWVQYQTDGTFFLSPIRSDGSSIFRIGRAVPVKFRLTGASAGITNLVAKLVVTKISDAVRGSVEDVGDEDGEDTDFIFKYRIAQKLYGYRWKTRGETQGTCQLRADLGDGVVHQVNVSLRAANK